MKSVRIGKTDIGKDDHVFMVAELSANHLGDLERAKCIIREAANAGADAVKLQTYTPDTITLDSDKDYFTVTGGTIWDGRKLYDLYREAYTPWEWHEELFEYAKEQGLVCFSSPFDDTAVELLEGLKSPAYKIASYEITDIPLIRRCAATKKPVIMATGVAREEDIREAVEAARAEGNDDIILLKCVSSYPTPYEEVNLNMIPTIAKTFDCVTGLSDHTLGSAVAVASVALGARMIEKHLTLKRSDGGVDAAFSMEPDEFARMTEDVRNVTKALGDKEYRLTKDQERERSGARSLFVVKDIKAGEEFSPKNIRSVRPGDGLPPKMLDDIIGKKAAKDLCGGEPLREGDVS